MKIRKIERRSSGYIVVVFKGRPKMTMEFWIDHKEEEEFRISGSPSSRSSLHHVSLTVREDVFSHTIARFWIEENKIVYFPGLRTFSRLDWFIALAKAVNNRVREKGMRHFWGWLRNCGYLLPRVEPSFRKMTPHEFGRLWKSVADQITQIGEAKLGDWAPYAQNLILQGQEHWENLESWNVVVESDERLPYK